MRSGALGLLLDGLEVGGEARLLREGRAVLALGRPRDVPDLRADLPLGRADLRAHAHHVGVAVAERLREARLLLLERDQLHLQRLHRPVAEHEREALDLSRTEVRELVVERLLGDPLGARLEHGRVQRLELLIDQLSRPSWFTRPSRSRYACSAFSAASTRGLLLLQTRSESQPVASVEVVKRSSSDCSMYSSASAFTARAATRRVVGVEAQVHETRAGDRGDLHARAEGRDRRRERDAARIDGRRRHAAEQPLHALEGAHHRPGRQLLALLETEPLDHLLGERASREELVLRLVVVRAALDELDQLLVREHVRGVTVDQDLGRRLVDGPGRVVVDDRDQQAHAQAGDDDRATLVQHREIAACVLENGLVAQMGTPLLDPRQCTEKRLQEQRLMCSRVRRITNCGAPHDVGAVADGATQPLACASSEEPLRNEQRVLGQDDLGRLGLPLDLLAVRRSGSASSRPLDPRSVAPPAIVRACSTVMPSSKRYGPGTRHAARHVDVRGLREVHRVASPERQVLLGIARLQLEQSHAEDLGPGQDERQSGNGGGAAGVGCAASAPWRGVSPGVASRSGSAGICCSAGNSGPSDDASGVAAAASERAPGSRSPRGRRSARAGRRRRGASAASGRP